MIPDESATWQAELSEAVRTPEALAEFRGRNATAGAEAGAPRKPGPKGTGRTADGTARPATVPRSRSLLRALVDAYPGAAPEARARLVDWMTELQPLDAPEWTIAETRAANAAAGAPARPARADDLDQPRSAAQRSRLLALLDAESPERRTAAATALRDWPEPDVSRAVLRAYLRGRIDVLPDTTAPDPVHDGELTAPGVLPERALRWVARLPEDDLAPLVPLLVDWWEHGPPAVHEAARTALGRVPADALAHLLAPRVEAGELGLLDLLTGLRLLRTPCCPGPSAFCVPKAVRPWPTGSSSSTARCAPPGPHPRTPPHSPPCAPRPGPRRIHRRCRSCSASPERARPRGSGRS